MLEIQDTLNKKVNPDWRNAGYEWRDALTVEAVELFDHLPWKWWKIKKGPVDWGQINMEAVDLWHFILSEMLVSEEGDDLNRLVTFLIREPIEFIEIGRVTKAARNMIAVSSGDYSTAALLNVFFGLLWLLRVSFDDLYKLYVGKAKLNEFRWSHDYGGSYFKTWVGEEDNQFLTRLVDSLNVNSETFGEEIMAGLDLRYAEVQNYETKEFVGGLCA